jgi:YidC/Oxa1 family membrane protein insertase
MFTTLIVKPIFNLLVLIYALLPGHNFGLAIIIFTIVVRLLMWPLVKKQLHHAKAMRDLQPELKRIKKECKGNKQKESTMVMELYKERQINPFASVGILLVQLPILIGLYSGIRHIVNDPQTITSFSYPILRNLGWMKQLSGNIGRFDHTLFNVIDLTRSAINTGGGIYWPALLIVLGSAVAQFYQTKQLMPTDKNARSLRKLLTDAGKGNQADNGEINAAVGSSTKYLIPVMIFFFTIRLPSALSLYWLTTGLVAFWQQSRILKQDTDELEVIADAPAKPTKSTKKIIEGEVVPPKKSKKTTAKKGRGRKKR